MYTILDTAVNKWKEKVSLVIQILDYYNEHMQEKHLLYFNNIWQYMFRFAIALALSHLLLLVGMKKTIVALSDWLIDLVWLFFFFFFFQW